MSCVADGSTANRFEESFLCRDCASIRLGREEKTATTSELDQFCDALRGKSNSNFLLSMFLTQPD
jgi:hypothetical protein